MAAPETINYLNNKVIVITGAGSGFGRLVAVKSAALGARVVCGDINQAAVEATAQDICGAGGVAIAVVCDVTRLASVQALIADAVDRFDRVDVMINNAGIMPLAFFKDHATAMEHWDRCIDVNFRGVLNGCVAVHDQMIAQGCGHIVNMSSIYGNYPVLGGAVYGATKSAVNFLSESLRVETRGKIKVTVVKPSAVPSTGLTATILDQSAGIGSMAQNAGEFIEMLDQLENGSCPPAKLDPQSIEFASLDAEHIADGIVHAINQPWGVVIADVTLRASADFCVI